MAFNELEIIGLSRGEIKVYSAILNIGISTVNNVHEKTGFERRAIYDILNKLIEKGLVTYTVEQGKRTYQCAPPNRLKELINQKKEGIKKFENSLSDIERIYKSTKPKIDIEIFRGKEGIKSIFEDMLNYKKIYFIGGRWYITKLMPTYWANYNKRRIKKRIEWYNLVLEDAKNIRVAPSKFINVKILPKDFNGTPSIIFLFGNKVINVIWSESPLAFMIESEDIAKNYKKYHKYVWDNIAYRE